MTSIFYLINDAKFFTFFYKTLYYTFDIVFSTNFYRIIYTHYLPAIFDQITDDLPMKRRNINTASFGSTPLSGPCLIVVELEQVLFLQKDLHHYTHLHQQLPSFFFFFIKSCFCLFVCFVLWLFFTRKLLFESQQ